MGKLIQCSSRLAKKPYYFRITDTNVYSIEEVCYYICHNIYILQAELFNYDFAVWLKEELGMEDTAHKMENMVYGQNSLKDIVVHCVAAVTIMMKWRYMGLLKLWMKSRTFHCVKGRK